MGLKSADKPPFNRLTPHLASKAHWGVPEDGWRQVPSETAGCLSLLCSRSEKGRVLIRACLPARGDYSRTMPHFPFQNNRPARLTSVTANVSLWRWHMHTHSQEQQSRGRPHSIVSVLCKCVFWVYSAHLLCIRCMIHIVWFVFLKHSAWRFTHNVLFVLMKNTLFNF